MPSAGRTPPDRLLLRLVEYESMLPDPFERRSDEETMTRRMRLPKGEESKAVRGPREGEPVVPQGAGPDNQEDEDPPHQG